MKRTSSSDLLPNNYRGKKQVKLEPAGNVSETGDQVDAKRTKDIRMKLPIGCIKRETKRLTRVHFYVPDSPEASAIFYTALRDSAKANSTGMICSLYASAVTMLADELKQDFRDALMAHDLDLVEISLPSQAHLYQVDMTYDKQLSYKDVVALFGASLLLIFKDVGAEGYDKFMNTRLNALRSCVASDRVDPPSLPFDADHAATIRTFFGSNRDLCRKIVLYLIAGSAEEMDEMDFIMGGCCKYLLKMLAWSGLKGFGIMYETLLERESSVLNDNRVVAEAKAARQAHGAVKRCEHPPYFRFLGSSSDQNLVKRSRFPVLISVAVAIRKQCESSLDNFVTPISTDDPLVQDLVRIYQTRVTEDVAYLFDVMDYSPFM